MVILFQRLFFFWCLLVGWLVRVKREGCMCRAGDYTLSQTTTHTRAYKHTRIYLYRLPDDPLRWNFCRRFPTRDLNQFYNWLHSCWALVFVALQCLRKVLVFFWPTDCISLDFFQGVWRSWPFLSFWPIIFFLFPPGGDSRYSYLLFLMVFFLVPWMLVDIRLVYIYTSIDKIKENGFELTKKRSRRYPATTITDADYADDIAILANTPDQAETLLHSLERTAASIGLHVNAHKTEYMCYNQTGDISTLEGTPLKLVDKFTYLGSSVESTEKDIETRLTKAWTAINRLSTIWKSDLTDKMKRSFFQAAVTSILLYGCTTWTLTKRLEKKLDGNYTRMLRAILNKSWRQHPTRHQLYGHLPPLSRKLFKLDEPDMQDIAGEAEMNS